MKKTTLLIAYMVCAISYTQGQVLPTTSWVSTFKAIGIQDDPGSYISNMKVGPDGSTYMYGTAYKTINLGAGFLINLTGPSAPPMAFFVVKVSTDGQIVWLKQWNVSADILIPDDAYLGGLSIDGAGNLYISTVMNFSTLQLGGGYTINSTCGAGCSEVLIIKLDGNGNPVWDKKISSENVTQSQLAVAGDRIALFGDFSGGPLVLESSQPLPGGGPSQGHYWVELNTSDGDLADYRIDGDINITATSRAYAMLDSKGGGNGYFILSRYNEPVTFSDSLTLPTYLSSGEDEFFIAKMEAGLSPQKILNLNTNGYVEIFQIQADANGGLLVALSIDGNLRTKGSMLIAEDPTGNTYSNALLYYHPDSGIKVIEAIKISNTEESYPLMSCAIDNFGNFVTAGFFTESGIQINNQILVLEGCADAIISGGTLTQGITWAKKIGSPDCEGFINDTYCHALQLDGSGNIYALAAFTEGLNWEGITAPNASGRMLVKLDPGTVSTLPEAGISPVAMQISPNPNTGHFVLDIQGQHLDNPLLQIHDLYGRVVYSQQLKDLKQVTLSSDLDAGIYIVTLHQGATFVQQKMIVTHQ